MMWASLTISGRVPRTTAIDWSRRVRRGHVHPSSEWRVRRLRCGTMLRLVARAAQAGLLGLAAYNAAIALWGWRNRRPALVRPPETRFRVVMPAHNEGAVIGGILADLAAVAYPGPARRLWCSPIAAPTRRPTSPGHGGESPSG